MVQYASMQEKNKNNYKFNMSKLLGMAVQKIKINKFI